MRSHFRAGCAAFLRSLSSFSICLYFGEAEYRYFIFEKRGRVHFRYLLDIYKKSSILTAVQTSDLAKFTRCILFVGMIEARFALRCETGNLFRLRELCEAIHEFRFYSSFELWL